MKTIQCKISDHYALKKDLGHSREKNIIFRKNFDCYKSHSIKWKLLFLFNHLTGKYENLSFESLINSFLFVFYKFCPLEKTIKEKKSIKNNITNVLQNQQKI